MSELGCVFYRGPSLLTGDPIVGILTGLEGGSMNPKTGPMVQAWILRPDLRPMDAVRAAVDDAICGDCKLRGSDFRHRPCYVAPWMGPTSVYKSFIAGRYLDASWPELQALLEAQYLRLGAYGDPAAIPYEIWRMLLVTAAGWVGYTHAHRRCDPRFRDILMASVDNEREFFDAGFRGWRTFRVRGKHDALIAGAEFACPASDEMDHRVTCQTCQLCRGTSSPARSVSIIAHGHNGALTAFYKSRAELIA